MINHRHLYLRMGQIVPEQLPVEYHLLGFDMVMRDLPHPQPLLSTMDHRQIPILFNSITILYQYVQIRKLFMNFFMLTICIVEESPSDYLQHYKEPCLSKAT